MKDQFYVVINKYKFYTVRNFGGSLLELRQFADYWGVSVFEDLP